MKTVVSLFILLNLSSSAFAAFQIDKNLLIAVDEINQGANDPVQGMVLGEDETSAYIELFSIDESVQIQKAGYECSAPILFLNSGRYQRLCGYVDRRPPQKHPKGVPCGGSMGSVTYLKPGVICPFPQVPGQPGLFDSHWADRYR